MNERVHGNAAQPPHFCTHALRAYADTRGSERSVIHDFSTDCLSDAYSFSYVRTAGKVAGTTLQIAYLLQQMCHIHYKAEPEEKNITMHGGSTVPEGCERSLASQGIFQCIAGNHTDVEAADNSHAACTRSSCTVGSAVSFAPVRNPFARAVSIYRHVFMGVSTPMAIRGFARLYGRRRTTTTLDAAYSGHGVKQFHWQQQIPPLLEWCRLAVTSKSSTLLHLVRLEPNLLTNLDPVVAAINENRKPGLPPLPTPGGIRSKNVRSYKTSCPWQCYFELCGHACLEQVATRWFPLDVRVFDAAGLYAAPKTLAELWGMPSTELIHVNKSTHALTRLNDSARANRCRTMCGTANSTMQRF